MNEVLLVGILLLNIVISVWNCYAVGIAWKDTMAMGGLWNKIVLWSGLIQSGIGFSMPIAAGLTYVAIKYLTSGSEPTLSAEEAKQLANWIFSLWYLAVIFPVLGSGIAIWAHSVRIAFQRRDFSSIATAGWNSYAQIHNTLSAVEHLGGAFGNVRELFAAALEGDDDSNSSSKAKPAWLAIIIVAVSLGAGFILAFSLVRMFANSAPSRLEEYGRREFA